MFALFTEEQIHDALKKANHDQYMTMYGVKVKVLQDEEEVRNHIHKYWTFPPLIKHNLKIGYITDGISRQEMHSSYTVAPKITITTLFKTTATT